MSRVIGEDIIYGYLESQYLGMLKYPSLLNTEHRTKFSVIHDQAPRP